MICIFVYTYYTSFLLAISRKKICTFTGPVRILYGYNILQELKYFQFFSPIPTQFHMVQCYYFDVCFFFWLGNPVARGCVLTSDDGESNPAAARQVTFIFEVLLNLVRTTGTAHAHMKQVLVLIIIICCAVHHQNFNAPITDHAIFSVANSRIIMFNINIYL